ncbi:aldose 1-epimerase [Salinarchaeum sp. Harcht-Bsk1]|uniref:DUF4432 family protein n=1 Tax=Salinarchaeum sp. Harcht-Bsk1 TaxID=1333523 RepID=UPI0003423B35|nr:DUF4432 family protein [Salinarchaeum sp. Harcht-Bsk1]AGN01248.1 aldose 1-epimerase [Salinarchaeum sp. Harcht-Bsk1]
MAAGTHLRVDDAYAYRGIDAVLLENRHLQLLVLSGKGGDVLEFRDKRTDVDVLWHADHDWQAPGDGRLPITEPDAYHDHYPGGWQLHLPMAGETDDFDGTPYGLHGESALLAWDATSERREEAVTLHLETDLLRYPFAIERDLTLRRDEPTLFVEETVTNEGGVAVPFVWQQHLALGPPLVGPDARLELPAETGHVEDYGDGHENARLAGGERFAWPDAPGADGETVDLREFPPYDATIHDLAYATDLREGRYAVSNEEIDLRFEFSFPLDPFEHVWYWQPFGGHAAYPYWNRNYNVGLEPTSAYPAGDVPDAQRANGTLDHLAPGEERSASYEATVGPS